MDKAKLSKEIRSYCKALVDTHSARDNIASGIENEYMMHKTPEDEALEKASTSVALTKSPDARNSVKGVVRLMTTTRPEIKIPTPTNDYEAKRIADEMEQVAEAMLAASDRYNRRPLHYDATLSAVLYDEVHLQVISTQDLVDTAEGVSKVRLAKLKKLAATTPYVFEALSPRQGYPVWDNLGLQAYHSRRKVSIGSIVDRYGEAAKTLFQSRGVDVDAERLKLVTLCDYWDETYRHVWVDGYDGDLLLDEHGLPFIPIIASTVEGSGLFSSPEDQREPFLYTDYASGLSQRKTEALTAMATMGRVLGFSPAFVVQNADPLQEIPQMERVGLFQMFVLGPGQTITPMLNKGLIDPSTLTAYETFRLLGEESTIFKSILGQSQSDTYSQTALLSQLGRIPLETVRSMTGRAIADALEVAFEWMRRSSGTSKAYNYAAGTAAAINPQDIPEYINIEVDLSVSMPQDKLQQARIASTLKDRGLASTEWIHEEIMGIGQSGAMQRTIIKEQVQQALVQLKLQQMLQMAAQQQQAMAGQPMPGGRPLAGPQVPEEPATLQGLPPEMIAGGMAGPEEPGFMQQMEPPIPGEEGMLNA